MIQRWNHLCVCVCVYVCVCVCVCVCVRVRMHACMQPLTSWAFLVVDTDLYYKTKLFLCFVFVH